MGLATRALTGHSLINLRVNEAAALPHRRRLCCPSGSIGTTTASDAVPADRPLPGSPPVIGHRAPVSFRSHRAGDGLPSSRRHLLNVPRPLRRGVPRGCTPGSAPLPWPSPRQRGLGTPSPRLTEVDGRHFTTPQASLHATDRIVAPPLSGLLTLGFDPARFQTKPPACYRAPWRLPGPDFHRQATTSLRTRSTATSRLHLLLCWAHTA